MVISPSYNTVSHCRSSLTITTIVHGLSPSSAFSTLALFVLAILTLDCDASCSAQQNRHQCTSAWLDRWSMRPCIPVLIPVPFLQKLDPQEQQLFAKYGKLPTHKSVLLKTQKVRYMSYGTYPGLIWYARNANISTRVTMLCQRLERLLRTPLVPLSRTQRSMFGCRMSQAKFLTEAVPLASLMRQVETVTTVTRVSRYPPPIRRVP